MAKESEIFASNAEITRKVSQMFTCTKCSASLESGKEISCQLCSKNFHVSCTDNKHKKEALSPKEMPWVCNMCRVRPPVESLGHELSSMSLPEVSPNPAGSWEQYTPVEGSIPQSVGALPGQSVVSLISAHTAHTSPQLDLQENSKYTCDVCSFEANELYNLKKHKEDIHKIQDKLCQKCDFKSNTDIQI